MAKYLCSNIWSSPNFYKIIKETKKTYTVRQLENFMGVGFINRPSYYKNQMGFIVDYKNLRIDNSLNKKIVKKNNNNFYEIDTDYFFYLYRRFSININYYIYNEDLEDCAHDMQELLKVGDTIKEMHKFDELNIKYSRLDDKIGYII